LVHNSATGTSVQFKEFPPIYYKKCLIDIKNILKINISKYYNSFKYNFKWRVNRMLSKNKFQFPKFRSLSFFIILFLLILSLLFTGCNLISSLNTETTQIEGTATSGESEKTKEELIKEEDAKAKQEAIEKEKKDKELMESAQTTQEASMLADNIKPNGSCDLIIVTPLEFVAALIPLKDHKNNTGITTKVISLEDIYSNYDGRDEAEKVKYCIADYEKTSNIKFAMLVGDADKFPIRYTKTDRETAAAFNTAFYGTDFYYADLYKSDGSFDDWDNNKNGFFGELAGESSTGPLNVDNVDLTPDIAIGRIPASSIDEVIIYTSKVISYEKNFNSYDWKDNILLIATKDWIPDICLFQDKIARDYLKNKIVYKLYEFVSLYETISEKEKLDLDISDEEIQKIAPPNPQNIIDLINKGVFIVSHIGHGDINAWINCLYAENFTDMNNTDKLSIFFSIGCSTGAFCTLPPYEAYIDINGAYHEGSNYGEIFKTFPPQPACIQTENNLEGMGELSIAKISNGAIGYIGCITGGQYSGVELSKYFFESLTKGSSTLGEMWNYSIMKYYDVVEFPKNVEIPDWYLVASFHQPWKYFLFGDPSLRVNTEDK
jgi:hypothetical protein